MPVSGGLALRVQPQHRITRERGASVAPRGSMLPLELVVRPVPNLPLLNLNLQTQVCGTASGGVSSRYASHQDVALAQAPSTRHTRHTPTCCPNEVVG